MFLVNILIRIQILYVSLVGHFEAWERAAAHLYNTEHL